MGWAPQGCDPPPFIHRDHRGVSSCGHAASLPSGGSAAASAACAAPAARTACTTSTACTMHTARTTSTASVPVPARIRPHAHRRWSVPPVHQEGVGWFWGRSVSLHPGTAALGAFPCPASPNLTPPRGPKSQETQQSCMGGTRTAKRHQEREEIVFIGLTRAVQH